MKSLSRINQVFEWRLALAIVLGFIVQAILLGDLNAQDFVPVPLPEEETVELTEAESEEFDYSPGFEPFDDAGFGGDMVDEVPELIEDQFEDEAQGTYDAQLFEAVMGSDPITQFNSLMDQLSSINDDDFWPTPSDEIARLPSIEDTVFGGGSYTPQGLCGIEKRQLVSKTHNQPWRWTCKLVITKGNGSKAVATGWIVGPRTIITSGHVVHSGGSNGSWAKSIEVIPGMKGSRRPYGTFRSKGLVSVKGWTRSKNKHYDYGAIILKTDIGKRLGYFGYANRSTSRLQRMKVNTAGYPGDLRRGMYMYRTYDSIQSVTRYMLIYDFVTYGGQSGSAVWQYTNGKRYAVGIHGYGCPNSAVRINSSVFRAIKRWKYRK